jgi:hypothetical protein
LFPNCAKTHLCASAIPKIFPGVIPRTPIKGEEGFGMKEIRDRELWIGGERKGKQVKEKGQVKVSK